MKYKQLDVISFEEFALCNKCWLGRKLYWLNGERIRVPKQFWCYHNGQVKHFDCTKQGLQQAKVWKGILS